MKKWIALFLTASVAFASFPICVFADDTIKVIIDGEELSFDVPPQIINGRTMLPMRVIFEKLGATVDWDKESQMVQGTKDGTVIAIDLNGKGMGISDGVNTRSVVLDAPATVVNGRTLVPARAIAEGFDCKVDWDKNTKTVSITTPIPEPSEPAENTEAKPAEPEPEEKKDYVYSKSELVTIAHRVVKHYLKYPHTASFQPFFCNMTESGGNTKVEMGGYVTAQLETGIRKEAICWVYLSYNSSGKITLEEVGIDSGYAYLKKYDNVVGSPEFLDEYPQ